MPIEKTGPLPGFSPAEDPSRTDPGKTGLLAKCGPGVISGAANDDPSCIVSYAVAGASIGYATLWTSLYALPLLATVQLMCARLGMVSGRGLAGDIRAQFRPWVLFAMCSSLVLANVVTLGADLGGMADVTEMITGISGLIWTAVYAVAILTMLFYFPYRRLERVFKWLCLVLFAYVVAGVLSHADVHAVMASTFIPRVSHSREYLSVLVAIMGATMSPYFLFWQASQQVEEEYCIGRRTLAARKGATRGELDSSRVDVFTGAFISKLITYFITLTTAATLFAHGHKHIETARDAAAALHPIAGPAAYWLFALGVVGTGLLAIPTLAGSAAYAVSEAMHWRASLEEKPILAPKFYAVLAISMLLGMSLIYLRFNVVQMLFWASIFNGILAPPAIALVLLLTRNPKIMGLHVNSPLLNLFGGLTVVLTSAAAIGLLISFTQ